MKNGAVEDVFAIENGIFHCHLSLLEGNPLGECNQWLYLHPARPSTMILILRAGNNVIRGWSLDENRAPGYFLYIGDDILPSYIGVIRKNYKDPQTNQPGFNG